MPAPFTFADAVEILKPLDGREPDYSRTGIFIHHNCWRCDSGAKPCASGAANRCEYPRARND